MSERGRQWWRGRGEEAVRGKEDRDREKEQEKRERRGEERRGQHARKGISVVISHISSRCGKL